jgi:hypothetical protein
VLDVITHEGDIGSSTNRQACDMAAMKVEDPIGVEDLF